MPQPTEPRYLRTGQVAELLYVSPKTVSRWAQEGRLPYLRTLGGHRRYPDAEIRALLETLSELSPAGYPPRPSIAMAAAGLGPGTYPET